MPEAIDTAAQRGSRTLDPGEVDRFARLASEWWDPTGKFRTLHQIGPARLGYIRDELVRHFQRPAGSMKPFSGLTLLDIGCGGGLICEPLARLGGQVTGLDPAIENVEAARRHAAGQGLAVDYLNGTVEDLQEQGRTFDAVVCLEVVEHVPDVGAFLKSCAALVRPGGLMVLSTINRTMKAYLLAIVGAEYVLRWLPVGTHQWERFVTPDELAGHLGTAGLGEFSSAGLVYNPLANSWSIAGDTDVNYMARATRPV